MKYSYLIPYCFFLFESTQVQRCTWSLGQHHENGPAKNVATTTDPWGYNGCHKKSFVYKGILHVSHGGGGIWGMWCDELAWFVVCSQVWVRPMDGKAPDIDYDSSPHILENISWRKSYNCNCRQKHWNYVSRHNTSLGFTLKKTSLLLKTSVLRKENSIFKKTPCA